MLSALANKFLETRLEETNCGTNTQHGEKSLLNLAGQVYRQVTTKEAHLRFNDVAPTEYKIQV